MGDCPQLRPQSSSAISRIWLLQHAAKGALCQRVSGSHPVRTRQAVGEAASFCFCQTVQRLDAPFASNRITVYVDGEKELEARDDTLRKSSSALYA